jgi:hypothetical protein
MLCYLGLQELQPEEIRKMAPRIDHKTAHLLNSNGAYAKPHDHEIHSQCMFPFLQGQP